MDKLTQRVNRASEGILENESLTAGLDDETAQALLDWGLACAKLAARSTAGLDDEAAENATSPRLRATRRLMRLARRLAAQRLEAETANKLLAEMIERAAIIYGEDFTPPDDEQRQKFARLYAEVSEQPLQIINNLRNLIEKHTRLEKKYD